MKPVLPGVLAVLAVVFATTCGPSDFPSLAEHMTALEAEVGELTMVVFDHNADVKHSAAIDSIHELELAYSVAATDGVDIISARLDTIGSCEDADGVRPDVGPMREILKRIDKELATHAGQMAQLDTAAEAHAREAEHQAAMVHQILSLTAVCQTLKTYHPGSTCP